VAVAAVLGVAVPVAVLALGLSGGLRGAALPVVACGVAVALVWPVAGGLTARQYRERAAAERRYAEQAARLADRDRRDLVTAERTRMARELHDLVANHLSTIAVQSAAALSRPDPPACRQALGTIRDTSVQGLAELRRMIDLLGDRAAGTDEPLTTSPRLDELESLLERARRAGLAVTLEVTGAARPLPAAVDLAAYRIVRESLANARTHAGPVAAQVRLDYRPGCLAVTVDNPLPAAGHTGPYAGGAGLVAMRERATLLGGAFTAGERDGRWRVRADLPC
jgi:signal transduction histidine kinase